MFDAIFTRLSLRRACAGIYSELRTIRQMLEIDWQARGLVLPRDRRAAERHAANTPEADGEFSVDPELTLEQQAMIEADRIQRLRLEGKDPGTDWRPDPNR